MEINPNHPVTNEVREHWYKIVAIMMHTLGLKEFIITSSDIEKLPKDIAVGIHPKGHEMKVFLTDTKTAEAMAKKEGGLPT